MAKDAQGHGSDSGNRAAAATLAQGHPKSGGFAIQSFNSKLAGQPWQTERRVSASKSLVNPAAKAERIAMRMAADSTHRAAPSARQTFRVR